MTTITIAVAVLLAAHLALIIREQAPVWREANRRLLELEAEYGPGWIADAEADVLCSGLDLAREASRLQMPGAARRALDAMFATLDELAEERERGKAEAGRRLAT